MATRPLTARLDLEQRLLGAAVLFTVGVLLHNADHVRRGADSVTTDVLVAGTLAIGLEVGVVAAIAARHRVAPLLAAVTGWSLAGGYVLAHALPGRGWLSDPLLDGSGQGLSQAAAGFEILAAVVLGTAGAVALRAAGGLRSAAGAGEPDWSRARRHPAVLAMALGNAVVLVLTFAGG
jgi:hypothetical protein